MLGSVRSLDLVGLKGMAAWITVNTFLASGASGDYCSQVCCLAISS